MTRLDDLRAQLSSANEAVVNSEPVINIFGTNGVGKTTLAAKLADALSGGTPVLYCDAREGVRVLQDEEFAENVVRIPVGNPGDMAVVAHALRTRQRGFEDFTSVIVDEVNAIAYRDLEAYVREKNGIAPEQQLGEIEGRDYGPAAAMLRSWLDALVQTDSLNVILVCHEKQRIDQANGDETRKQTTFTPLLWPGALVELLAPVNVSARMTNKVGSKLGSASYTRELQSWPTTTVNAKCQFKTIQPRMSDEDWLNAILDEVYGPEDPDD